MHTLKPGLAIALCMLPMLFSACGTATVQPVQGPQLHWPPAPAVSRINYVREFSTPQQLGIEKGGWRKLVEFFTGEEQQRIVRPMDIVVDQQGVIYVADPGAGGVHRFDVHNKKYLLLRRMDSQNLPSPVALALGADNSVYVSDSQLGQVFHYQTGDKALQALDFDSQVYQPTGLAYEPHSARLYVVDTLMHRVLVFDRQGVLQNEIGTRGAEPGQFNYPTYLWLDSKGRLYVTDSLNFRVQIFSPEGRFVHMFGQAGDATGNLSRAKGVATDSDDNIYIVDGLLNSLQIFNQAGELLSPVGERGTEPGQFWLPVGIYIDHSDTLYIADSHNQRVQVLRYVGGQQ